MSKGKIILWTLVALVLVTGIGFACKKYADNQHQKQVAKITAMEKKASQKAKADYEFLFMHPDGKQLEKLGKLVADKKLKVRLDKEFDFDDLQTACDYVATGHANGKVIIDVMG